jgi:hypothetical protein
MQYLDRKFQQTVRAERDLSGFVLFGQRGAGAA